MKKISILLMTVFLAAFLTAGAASAEEEAFGESLQTPHALVMEVSTGKVLFEKDADTRIHPASVTKIMTILLIYEAMEDGTVTPQQEVVTSAHAKSMGGSQVFLEEGEVQTVDTLLKCIIIASGNDAAVAMAEQIAGTEEAFVARMNEKAKELGMENTHFADCCGLTDSADHYTSARDVALMSRELLLCYPQVVEYSSIWMEDITHVTAKGSSVFTLSNTNKLLRAFNGCDGLKTGSTSIAKYCLSATARRDGIRLISTVMTSPDSKTRFSEAGQLLNYGFSRCTMYHDEEREALPDIEVKGSLNREIRVEYGEDFSYLSTENEDFSQIEKNIEWQANVEAPVKAGDPVGAYVYTLNGKEIGRVPVVAAEDADKAGYLDYLNEMWKRWAI
ncbi:MAG TPA: D-alanyl-D-alanine carboxypeptidase [Candidatus Choladousia intestinipullorum]|nr:D-alanyl-D-alanine carboxypeptidase [Candidatus Choladousia intestinipullorum]